MSTAPASRPPSIPAADLSAIRAAVTARRTAAGLTGAELARLAGISQPSLWKIESGAAAPSLGTLLSLARALGCGLGELAPVPVPGPGK